MNCRGHESTNGPIGNVVYCDGSCRPVNAADVATALALWNEIAALESKMESRTWTAADVARFNDAVDAFDAFDEDVCQAAMARAMVR